MLVVGTVLSVWYLQQRKYEVILVIQGAEQADETFLQQDGVY
jgi:hypothetical protein